MLPINSPIGIQPGVRNRYDELASQAFDILRATLKKLSGDSESMNERSPLGSSSQGNLEPGFPVRERRAYQEYRKSDAEKAITDLDGERTAFHLNRKRLKAERLAREAITNEA